MLRNRLYYTLKPWIPRALRLAIRSRWARRKRARVSDHWPIFPGSERPPEGWPGWPEGKQFAFVLTHDVEGPEGLSKVKRLAELEMSLGFRSSFNFIPEGPYQVPDELRAWLEERGFEVGVHDLHHDGKLYHSRAEFARKALRINHYIKAWGAAGFRAGFMLHNLDWLHDLEILYDASTFDTDPFEPQPDYMGTIFPFWVPRPRCAIPEPQAGITRSHVPPHPSDLNLWKTDSGASTPGSAPIPSDTAKGRLGYVELPYTLPQDSTLFLLLREQTPELWLHKLDWIAAHGGMALVNVHPDYLRFTDNQSEPNTFSVQHYRALLEYVRGRHSSAAWHVRAKDVAAFVHSHARMLTWRRPLRVAMVSHSDYRSDGRVIRYAESLAARGDSVQVLGLRSSQAQSRTEVLNGVRVHCLQDRFSKRNSVSDHLRTTVRFFTRAVSWLTLEHRRWPFDLIHVHNIPDFLVFAAAYPRWRGAKIILDIHDLVPEFFDSKFRHQSWALSLRALFLMERWSARFAHHCIIANDLWLERYRTRTGVNGRCSVLINHVDTTRFRLRTSPAPGSAWPLILFPGSLHWHQGVDLAIRAFARLLSRYPSAEFHIYGDGPMKSAWMALAAALGVGNHVRFSPPVPADEIAIIMARADLGVVPKRADSFGNEAYSTKIMEFMALGVPVVVADTRVDRHYFDDSLVKFFHSGDVEALYTAMVEVLEQPELTARRVACAATYAVQNSWQVRKHDYLRLVDQLCAPNDKHARP